MRFSFLSFLFTVSLSHIRHHRKRDHRSPKIHEVEKIGMNVLLVLDCGEQYPSAFRRFAMKYETDGILYTHGLGRLLNSLVPGVYTGSGE